MRVAVVAEYYPRAADPALGVWAHRQALAARDAGADVHVLVLHRPVPSRRRSRARPARCSRRCASRCTRARRAPRHLRAVPRPAAAAHLRPWGAWAAPTLALALRACAGASRRPRARALRRAGRRRRAARPAGRPARGQRARRRRARASPRRWAGGREAVRAALAPPGSCWPTRRDRRRAPRSAPRDARVVHLGTDLPEAPVATDADPARHRRQPGRPQAPRRRAARAVAAARRAPDAALGRRRRRAGAPGARAPGRRARARRPRRVPRPRRAGRGARRRAPRRGLRAAERRRGVRRRLRRGDGRRRARDRLRAARPGPEEIAAAGGGMPPRRARRARGARRASCAALLDEPALAARARRRPRAPTSRPTSPGRRAGARRSPPTRTRCGEARSCSSPTTRRRSASARSRALHEREDVVVRADRRRRAPRRRRQAARALPFPVAAAAPSGAVARLAASGRFRAVVAGLSGPRRAARRVRSARAPRGVPVRALGDDLARTRARPRTRSPTCRCATSTATPTRSPPTARTSAPTCAPRARAGRSSRRPQSVDDGVLVGAGRAATGARRSRRCSPGASTRGEGLGVLLRAWRRRAEHGAALVLAGGGPLRARARRHRRRPARAPPAELRNFYAGSDVVVVPSVPTRDFLEPWGLVVNEAFHQGVPVIATDAVGAAAGGLVRHERTGLVVPAGRRRRRSPRALRRLHDDPALRARLGAAAREAVAAYTHDAWAAGMARALAAAGASRASGGC